MQAQLTMRLLAEPREFSRQHSADFTIGIALTNTGSTVLEPRVYDTILLVDGKRAIAWDLAVQNGTRDKSWWQLQPGQTVTGRWPLAEALFPQPGTYRLVLRRGELISTAEIEVTP